MLLIEGCDKAGKTTLIKNLGLDARHLGLLPDTWDYFQDYTKLDGLDKVWDRFHISELVYGPIMRGKIHPRFTPVRQRAVWRALANTGSHIVIASPPWSVIKERWEREGDEHVNLKQLHQIWLAFHTGSMHGLRAVMWDGKDKLNWFFDSWMIAAVLAEDAQAIGGYGSHQPKWLFFGESSSVIPFSHDETACERLCRLLDEASIDEGDVRFFNTMSYDASEAVEYWPAAKTIAFGREAERLIGGATMMLPQCLPVKSDWKAHGRAFNQLLHGERDSYYPKGT